MVTGLDSKLQLAWSPRQLSQDFGGDLCTVEDCEGKVEASQKKLKDFLQHFAVETPEHISKVKVIT